MRILVVTQSGFNTKLCSDSQNVHENVDLLSLFEILQDQFLRPDKMHMLLYVMCQFAVVCVIVNIASQLVKDT